MRTNEVASSSSLVFSNSSTRLSSSFFERGVCTKRVLLKVTTRMQKKWRRMFFGLLKKKLCFWSLQKIFSVQNNKKRRKTTRDATYSALSGIPSGVPPGNTRTKELRHSLRGPTDARLESVLSTDECLCDACCARFSTPHFVVLFSYFGLKIFFRPKQIFLRPKNTCRNTNNEHQYFPQPHHHITFRKNSHTHLAHYSEI